ncbi:hypothetical protein V8G54_016948 [Vigna mungo]|uniref:Uncharacterized protein n=1 Tax=Vigna mungo TaxID=3915 RepID=A0AAQ3NNX0_VIGMU
MCDPHGGVKVANQVGSIPLDWALGAFILQTTADADIQNRNWIATIFSDESPTLLSIIGFLLVLLTAWSISRNCLLRHSLHWLQITVRQEVEQVSLGIARRN